MLTLLEVSPGSKQRRPEEPQYNSASASGVRGEEGCYPDSPRSKGEDYRVQVKVRHGQERPHSKLLDQISTKEEQLIRDTATTVFKINFKNCLLYASDIRWKKTLVNLRKHQCWGDYMGKVLPYTSHSTQGLK